MFKYQSLDTEGELSRIELTISPDRIFFLKFILEGYDGLAILTTIDNKKGQVVVKFASELFEEVSSLLTAIIDDLT